MPEPPTLIFPNIVERITTEKCIAKMNRPKYIVVHHTGSKEKTDFSAKDWLSKTPNDFSTHYVIGSNGNVWKINEEEDVMFHISPNAEYNLLPNMMYYSIGIHLD